MPRARMMPRGKRPPRAAAVALSAINNILLNAKKPNLVNSNSRAGSSGARPSFVPANRPRSGVGVKNIKRIRVRNRAIKIKKLLSQPKNVEVKKNGVVLRKMVVRRKTYFPGRRKVTY